MSRTIALTTSGVSGVVVWSVISEVSFVVVGVGRLSGLLCDGLFCARLVRGLVLGVPEVRVAAAVPAWPSRVRPVLAAGPVQDGRPGHRAAALAACSRS